ncbi:hypothetical protein Hanom_Chr16g01443101 [Helianthus anomalus]
MNIELEGSFDQIIQISTLSKCKTTAVMTVDTGTLYKQQMLNMLQHMMCSMTDYERRNITPNI